MLVNKINESFSYCEGTKEELNIAFNYLKIYDPSKKYDKLVQIGVRSPYKCFGSIQHGKLLVYNGHINLIDPNYKPITYKNDVIEFKNILDSIKLPFKPYDYQIRAAGIAIMNKRALLKSCTSSGKSLIISMILEYFRTKGLKGVLVVPNINLLTQFKNDIKSYNLNDLYNEIQIHGDGNKSNFDTVLTISTWQSLVDEKKTNFDFIICDEVHRFASDITSDIIQRSTETPIKLGFTGTLPENPVDKMTLLGLFGQPYTIITAKELIDRGLGCPVNIKSIIIDYDSNSKSEFFECADYQKQLQYIIDHQKRNELIVNISTKLSLKNQNSLVLFQRTNHGKQLFIDIMKILYPNVKIENKDITGKKSLEFQKQYNVFFLNGEQDSKTREEVRHIMENNFIRITLEDGTLLNIPEDNDVKLTTGINIKASDLKETDEISNEWLNEQKMLLRISN